MRKIEKYVCSKCGSSFDTEKDCIAHEANHPSVPEIKVTDAYFYVNESVPEFVTLQMKADGKIITARYAITD